MDKVRQYFENTSLHGPKYITEFGRHYVEKFLWILVFTAASTLGVYLTVRIVNKWNQTPTLTSISTTNFPLNKIPFPAVTICPNTKGLRGKIVNEICRQSWTDHMDPDLVLLGLYNAISPMLGPENEYENDSTENFLDLTITEVISVLKRVSPKCSDYLLHCTWNSVKYNCSELFKVTSTDVGFCCSFNLVPPNQILSNIGNSDNLDDDFDDDDEDDEEDEDDYGGENYNYEDTTVEDYAALYSSCDHWLTHLLLNGTKDQWEGTCDAIEAKDGSKTNKITSTVFSTKYVLGHGLDDGLSLIIDPLVCELLSTDFFDGLKVYVHNSDTFPEVGQRGFIVDKATVNYVALNAYVTESSMDIKRYSNTTRLCNFPDERQLKYYKNYTRANCELEAKIDNFKTKCGCKPYYFPGDFVICDKEGMKCIRQNQSKETYFYTIFHNVLNLQM